MRAGAVHRLGGIESTRWLARFFRDPVMWFGELRAAHGDVVALSAGPTRMLVVHDVDVLERVQIRETQLFHKGAGLRATRFVLGDGLITADGESWRRHRSLMAPLFTPRTIGAFAESMVAIVDESIAEWPDDGVVPIARDAYDVALRIAGVGLFGTDFSEGERRRLHASLHALNEGYRTVAGPGGELARRLRLTPAMWRLARATSHVDEVVRAMIAARRRDADASELGDVLSRLLAARDGEHVDGMGDTQVRDEVATMLLAGHDTTAASLAWCLAMVAQRADVQEALAAEQAEVLTGGRRAGADDLRALAYARAVVSEVMRLNPVVYSTVRDPIEPVDLGDGMVLPPGTDLVVPIAGLHRDERHWDAPLEFRPERFLDAAAMSARHRMAYQPFGAGARICIGSSFAQQELVLALTTIVQQFELIAPPDFELTPEIGFIRRPAGDVPLHVRRR